MNYHRQPTADLLRQLIRDSGQAVNAIAVEARISQPVLWAFMRGGEIKTRTLDKLIAHFDLELTPRKRRTRR